MFFLLLIIIIIFFYITDQLQGCVVLIGCVHHTFSALGCYLCVQWCVRLISLYIWELWNSSDRRLCSMWLAIGHKAPDLPEFLGHIWCHVNHQISETAKPSVINWVLYFQSRALHFYLIFLPFRNCTQCKTVKKWSTLQPLFFSLSGFQNCIPTSKYLSVIFTSYLDI